MDTAVHPSMRPEPHHAVVITIFEATQATQTSQTNGAGTRTGARASDGSADARISIGALRPAALKLMAVPLLIVVVQNAHLTALRPRQRLLLRLLPPVRSATGCARAKSLPVTA
jgi:hypothetical protein